MSYQQPSRGVKRGRGLSAKQKGQIASIKFARVAPWSTHGAARILRGSTDSLSNFGTTFKAANPQQRVNRKASGFTGRGKYNYLRAGWRAAVPYLRNAAIAGATKMATQYMGGGLYTQGSQGSGLYTEGSGLYTTNNLIAGENSRPSMTFESSNDETQSLILTHKEYVSDIFGPPSAAFTNVTYPINPGLSAQFPFLAQFAANFDEYELIQMIFEFHSTVDSTSTNNTSGNTGTIIMATNYKSDAQPFLTKEEMIQYHGGVSGRVTEMLMHGVECDPSKNAMGGAKFVRSTPVANSDIKTYDSGIFQLAIQNAPSAFFNQQIGELWVHYKVKLSKPKLTTALANASTVCKYVSKVVDPVLLTGAPTAANLMGGATGLASSTTILAAYNNNFNVLVNDQTSNTILLTFPAQLSGVFEVVYTLEGLITTSGTYSTPTMGGQVTEWKDMYASADGTTVSPSWFTKHSSTNANCVIYAMRVKVLQATAGSNNTLSFKPIGTTGTVSLGVQSSIEIREIGSQFQQSNSIQAPIFVNGAGVVTLP